MCMTWCMHAGCGGRHVPARLSPYPGARGQQNAGRPMVRCAVLCCAGMACMQQPRPGPGAGNVGSCASSHMCTAWHPQCSMLAWHLRCPLVAQVHHGGQPQHAGARSADREAVLHQVPALPCAQWRGMPWAKHSSLPNATPSHLLLAHACPALPAVWGALSLRLQRRDARSSVHGRPAS